MAAASELAANPISTMQRTGGNPDNYYQTVAVDALLSILTDQSLNSQHHKVIEAIMSIFKTQGLKCISFLPQVSKWLQIHALNA